MMPVHVQPPRPAAVAAAALPTIVPWRPWTGFASSSKLITSCVYTSRIGVSSRSGTVTPFAGHRRLPAQLLWRQSALQPERASQPAIGNESEDIEEEEEEMEEYEEYEEDGEWDDDGEEGEWDEDEDDLMSSTAAGERTEGANASSSSSSSSSSMRPGIRSIPAEQSSVAYTPDDFVEVGVVSRPHGVRGEVKVQLLTDQPRKRLGTRGRRLWLQQPLPLGGSAASTSPPALRRLTVQSGRVARPESRDRREEWAVKFSEVADRDAARMLAGCRLLLALCDREAAPGGKDEFFIADLVGLAAREACGTLLGVVTEVLEPGGGYALLRIRLAPDATDIAESRYRSLLVPFVEGMVPSVDVGARSMTVTLPEGLLDTASVRKLARPYTPQQATKLRAQLRTRQQAAARAESTVQQQQQAGHDDSSGTSREEGTTEEEGEEQQAPQRTQRPQPQRARQWQRRRAQQLPNR